MELDGLFRFAQCRDLDSQSIAAGIPEQQLMGQAALASLYALEAAGVFETARRLLILCGPGNNGGDGYALAYMLAGRRSDRPLAIQVYATSAPKSSAARYYADLVRDVANREAPEQHIRLELTDADAFLRIDPGTLHPDTDCIIEAMLGTGQTAAPRGVIAQVLEHLQSLQRRSREMQSSQQDRTVPRVISLDLPVGLREDDSQGPRLIPDEIHSYGVDKLALRLDPSIAAYSQVQVLPIGFLPPPSEPQSSREPRIRSLNYAGDSLPALQHLTEKSPLSHKYSAGHGLLVGGSPGMEGALIMAARAFFAAGGGILHAVVPDPESRQFLTASLPGVMFLDQSQPLPENLRPRAIAIGPGLAADDLDATLGFLEPLFARFAGAEPPWLVLDAGALEFIQDSRFPESFRSRTVLTPHTGEWKRLGGPAIDCVHALDEALQFHTQNIRTYCLVKDAIQVFLGPGDVTSMIGVRHRPNPALAVAGSGDNLTGILLAFFARRRANSPESPESPEVPGPFELVAAALELLDRAGRLSHHPRADQFPDLIRRVLGTGEKQDSRAGRPDNTIAGP